MTECCSRCHQLLTFRGVQRNDLRGTEADLAECRTPGCPEFERTYSFNERPMPPEIRAARRAALERSIAQHGSQSMLAR